MSYRVKLPWMLPQDALLEDRFPGSLQKIVLTIPQSGSSESQKLPEPGKRVQPGECLAQNDNASLHSPVAGSLADVTEESITILPDPLSDWQAQRGPGALPSHEDDYPAFLAAIGLLGMGGAMFPASVKLRASVGAEILVINGVECEPGVTIDRAVLRDADELVAIGAEASARAVGAGRIILALSRGHALPAENALNRFDTMVLPSSYPAGAEKLIMKRLLGRTSPAGRLPFEDGVLVQNASSLRAVGRAIRDGIPVVERPLTLFAPQLGVYRNIIAPIGLPVADLLSVCGISEEACDSSCIVAGGLMMGALVDPAYSVNKGLTSLSVVPVQHGPEKPCIRCGACYDACPLGLHPIAMVNSLRESGVSGKAVVSQLGECFLCGLCSAVCPSRIGLANDLREGRQCMKE